MHRCLKLKGSGWASILTWYIPTYAYKQQTCENLDVIGHRSFKGIMEE